jgi:hypothetical protein
VECSLSCFGCLGLCLDGFSICLLVGGPLEGRGVLQCGKWCLFSFVGAYGGKEIIGALRTWGGHWRLLLPYIVSLDCGLCVPSIE